MERLIGVYDSDGGLWGDLRYIGGKILGTANCPLCEITHGWHPTGRRSWKQLRSELPMPMDLVHRNEVSPEILHAAGGRTPCLIGLVDGRIVRLLGPEDLEACAGDVSVFRQTLEAKMGAQGLDVASAPKER